MRELPDLSGAFRNAAILCLSASVVFSNVAEAAKPAKKGAIKTVALKKDLPLEADAMDAILKKLYGYQPTAHIVIENRSGRILSGEHIYNRVQPASLAKVLTLMIAFDELRAGNIQTTDMVKFSRNATQQGNVKLGTPTGKSIPLETALEAVAILSANDAAVALAEHISGSEAAFAIRMNEKAKELGMTDSHFVNASGWKHPDQYSTARDLGLLGAAMKTDYPEYFPMFSKLSFNYGKTPINGHNHVLEGYKRNGMEGIPGVDGLKTGFLRTSGFQQIVSYTHEARDYILVTLGNPTKEIRYQNIRGLIDNIRLGFGMALSCGPGWN